MDNPLSPVEVRVLGALIEKESTTPEYYPMTLNSLVAACNQKTNRWPVSEYTEGDVTSGLDGLKARGYAAAIIGGGRVTKFAERFTENLNVGRRETAILCVLLLRGPQTVGEIKGRTERMYAFADLEETETVLHKMMNNFVQELPHARYAHTLGGPVEAAAPASAHTDRISVLETEIARLREEVAELRRRLDEVLN
jgi:uncharacterized protein YceH (UPF0502 family)